MKIEEYIISLTGKDSHKIILEPGVGSFSIGTKGTSSGEFYAWVGEKDVLNWEAFNEFYVPATLKVKDKFPYGDWPRFFYYSGNDLGFIDWSKKRKIEEFNWYPQKDITADFRKSNIGKLEIHVFNNIKLLLGENIDFLGLYGNLNKYKIERCDKVPLLFFSPKYEKDVNSYKLPIFTSFADAKEIHITVDPSYPPFDCKSLLQFPNLKKLYLDGNMTNFQTLKELKFLEKIGLWNVRDLSNFPNLNDWEELSSFVAVNVEKNVGLELRKELRKLKKSGKLEEYSTVSNLKSVEWFENNCGIPFSYWEGRNEKKAMVIYEKCLKEVSEAETEGDIKNAIIGYTKKLNKIDNIESEERDDVYIALCKIMDNSPIEISYEKWFSWFDETRDF